MILNIQKSVINNHKVWYDVLSKVLETYKTSDKIILGMSPFNLIYDHNTILLIKLIAQSLIKVAQCNIDNTFSQ